MRMSRPDDITEFFHLKGWGANRPITALDVSAAVTFLESCASGYDVGFAVGYSSCIGYGVGLMQK